MGLTLATPIATARTILNDAGAVRYTAPDLLLYGNDCIDLIASLLPELFHTESTHACTAGAVEQELAVGTALAVVRVKGVTGGNAVTIADRATLDAFSPGWRSATAAAAINWMPVDGHPRRFLIYPKAPAGQSLDITYVAAPPEYTVDQDTALPMSLADPIADYIIYRAESRDDEHVNSARATQFMTSFVQKVKGG